MNMGAIKHDAGKLRYDLLPPDALEELVRVYTIGADKYGDHNWLKGMEFSRLFAAMQRHAWKFWKGEDTDNKDGQNHLASVAWCALTLLVYQIRGIGEDDRVPDMDNMTLELPDDDHMTLELPDDDLISFNMSVGGENDGR